VLNVSSEAAKISAKGVCKVYDTARGKITAVEDFSLDVADGEFVCIVGPSGCGKSTFLRMAAGLEDLSSGLIHIRPSEVPGKPLNSVVFQEYAVFPWKTVIQNVAFGLQMRGLSKRTRLETAHHWLDRVGLSRFAETRKTVVYITHSLEESVLLGDRVVLMSAQPGRIMQIYDIDLPRPRSIETMNLPRFSEYRATIWDKLSREVTRAMEMQE
jgi:NitT/TauT family transport system ATP-binding protein